MQIHEKPQNIYFILALGALVFGLFHSADASADESNSQLSTGHVFGELFTGSPCNNYGSVGCTQTGARCNLNWHSYFTYTHDSITMTAGDDCRTVNTYNSCQMTLGDGGVTQITFDFEVSDACHGDDGTAWLAFWIYRIPWNKYVEVDFIESLHGPSKGGLNSNFAGVGHQVSIFSASSKQPWQGSITAEFKSAGSGDVAVQVSNSVNQNVATNTLTADSGYFFVMDTAPGTSASNCTITVKNVAAVGSVASAGKPGNCAGLSITPGP